MLELADFSINNLQTKMNQKALKDSFTGVTDHIAGSPTETKPQKGNEDSQGGVNHTVDEGGSHIQQEKSQKRQQVNDNTFKKLLDADKQQDQQKLSVTKLANMSGNNPYPYGPLNNEGDTQHMKNFTKHPQYKVQEQPILPNTQQLSARNQIYNFVNFAFDKIVQDAFRNISYHSNAKSLKKIASICQIGEQKSQKDKESDKDHEKELEVQQSKDQINFDRVSVVKILQRYFEPRIIQLSRYYNKLQNQKNENCLPIKDIQKYLYLKTIIIIQAYFTPQLRILQIKSISSISSISSDSSNKSGFLILDQFFSNFQDYSIQFYSNQNTQDYSGQNLIQDLENTNLYSESSSSQKSLNAEDKVHQYYSSIRRLQKKIKLKQSQCQIVTQSSLDVLKNLLKRLEVDTKEIVIGLCCQWEQRCSPSDWKDYMFEKIEKL